MAYHFTEWGSPTSFMMARYLSVFYSLITLALLFGIGYRLAGTWGGSIAGGLWAIDDRVVEINRKIMLEGLLRSFNDMHKMPYVALRYFNVYGPRMDLHGRYTEVLIRWMDRIAAGQPPLILGDGKTTMDFIYIEDVARSNILSLESDVSDEVFNVASGVETSLNDLAAALLRVMGSKLKPEYGPERSVNPVSRRLACTKKAEAKLGFRSTISLEDGLARLVDWWTVNKDKMAA
jgi:UDP-glucose 4-epimerase